MRHAGYPIAASAWSIIWGFTLAYAHGPLQQALCVGLGLAGTAAVIYAGGRP